MGPPASRRAGHYLDHGSGAGGRPRRADGAHCDPDCVKRPCTQAQIRAARNTAAYDPAIILWAELAVLAALAGRVPPVPRQDFSTRLLDLPTRLLGCTLSHAVDAGVAVRAGIPGACTDPAGLAAHVTTALRDYAACGRPFPAPEARWLDDPCRWGILIPELEAHIVTAGHDAPPHPDTSVWAGQYGRTIPGTTAGEQLAAVRAWNDTAWTRVSAADRRALAFGIHTPSAIDKTAGCPAGAPHWRGRLAAVLAETFTDGEWALNWLSSRRAPRPGNR